jgi:hypothetical protein
MFRHRKIRSTMMSDQHCEYPVVFIHKRGNMEDWYLLRTIPTVKLLRAALKISISRTNHHPLAS